MSISKPLPSQKDLERSYVHENPRPQTSPPSPLSSSPAEISNSRLLRYGCRNSRTLNALEVFSISSLGSLYAPCFSKESAEQFIQRWSTHFPKLKFNLVGGKVTGQHPRYDDNGVQILPSYYGVEVTK